MKHPQEQFAILFNKEKADALGFMCDMFMQISSKMVQSEDFPLFKKEFAKHMYPMSEIVSQLSDRVHENDWCDDPDCEEKKKTKNEHE